MGSSKKSKDKDREKSREERKEKKRKHRELVGSKDRDKDKESRHHHRHHKHKKQRSKRREDRSRSRSHSPSISEDSLSDVELLLNLKDDVPSSSQRSSPPPKISRSSIPPPQPSGGDGGGGGGGGGGGSGAGKGDISLSIEETNKIRAKLGLRPLKVDEMPAPPVKNDNDNDNDVKEEKLIKSQGEEFVHKPAENLAQKLQVEKLREKIAIQREKRRLNQKVKQMKTLGESDSEDDSAKAWVKKSRMLSKERQEAEKRNKIMEELDEQFGIGDLLEKDIKEEKVKKYNHNSLAGLTIEHDMTRFDEGRTTILTLKDSNILDKEEDTLVNVNIIDDEITERNVKRRLKKKDDMEYEAPQVDEFGNITQSSLLTKYDEEIGGEKKKSFKIGYGGESYVQPTDNGPSGVPDAVRKMAKLRKLQSLEGPQVQLASEYFTEKEMVSFRKVKKTKKKKKKKLTADDLVPLEDDSLVHLGSRSARHERIEAMQVDKADEDGDTATQPEVTRPVRQTLQDLLEEEEESVKKEDEDMDEGMESEEQDDIELQEALARSRRAKLTQAAQPSSEKIMDHLKKKRMIAEDRGMSVDDDGLNMTLNTTDEFCRTLGDIPTYGLSGNRAEEESISMLQLQPKEKEAQEPRGAWEEVGIDDTRVEISDNMTVPILEEEPDSSRGVANALKLAVKKGYLEKTNATNYGNAALQHLRAVHYSIEDKAVDDDRRGNRGERYVGPVTDFKEKNLYRPDVKLEYVDDEGRKLNSKEAFRYLSHKFHGKGSGKNKTEKRMKKWNEELLMKHMSSSDTPLQTLERQREKQKQLGAAYLVLSGSKTQESMDVKK